MNVNEFTEIHSTHVGNFMLKDIIMDHDSNKQISLCSSLQLYHMTPPPNPKDTFLQVCVLASCICYTCLLLTPTFISPSI